MRPIRRIFGNISLFWRSLFLLTTIMAIFLACQLITGRQYTTKLREEYLLQAEDTFTQNCSTLSSNVGLLYSLPAVLENSQHYSYVSYFREPIPNTRYFALNLLRRSFAKTSALLQLQEESFFVFKGSYCGSTRLRSFPDMQDCFSDYLCYAEKSADEIRQEITGLSGIDILPVQSISIAGSSPKEYLTVLLPSSSTGSSLVIGILYPVDKILDAFDVQNLPQSTWFSLCTNDGAELLSYNEKEENADYHVFTCSISTMGAKASIGIPDDYFTSIIRPITGRISVIIAAVYLLGVLLCVLFSSISVQPMRRLISSYVQEDTDGPSGNELNTIHHLLVQNRQSQEHLSLALLSGVLDRACAGLPMDDREIVQIEACFPHFFSAGRICMIRNLQDAEATAGGEMLEVLSFLTGMLGSDYYLKYINKREIVILCRHSDTVEQTLFHCLQLANEELQGQVLLVAGISLVFCGVSEMEGAFYEAYSAIPLSSDLILSRCSGTEVPDTRKKSAVTGQKLDQFYQALRQWDKKAAFAVLDALEEPLRRIPNPAETVNLFLFILRDAADAAGIRFPDSDFSVPRTAHDGMKLLR
ncbi:MAG: hypothetical protein MJ118_02485, partial [Clostridia bacterium]|nr:hypothetical protein [Clostridia bacterium]